MARLPALIDDLAEHDVRGRPTVELVARTIREAGLIQTTKRGKGAAEMTAADAAALLIGLCASESPKEAPAVVKTFCALTSHPDPDTEGSYPPALARLCRVTTFGEAIEVLIASAKEVAGQFDERTTDLTGSPTRAGEGGDSRSSFGPKGPPWRDNRTDFRLKAVLRLPHPWAEIELQWEDKEAQNRFGRFRRAGRMFLRPDSESARIDAAEDGYLDRSVEVSLGFRTFLRIAHVLTTPLVPPWAG